jgi:crotonobetainyl-CoA:carnitine CoA-transferase CaiB-like acyl-CoA transferase
VNGGEPLSRPAPLSGVRVADFTHAVAGSFATMLLGDMGADVIKIERPERGDSNRYMNMTTRFAGDIPRSGGDYFLAINRNKRSVAIDLSCEAGKDLAMRLIERSDVVAQSFRPGVMERLHLGYADIQARKPTIVYASLSAYGERGPLSGQPGMDVAVQARSGVMAITGYAGSPPVKPGASLSDLSGGVFMAMGIMGAILSRMQTGNGQHVTCSLLDATMAMLSNYVVAVVDGGADFGPMGSGHPQIVPFQAFPSSDGYVVISAGTNRIFRDLCRLLDVPELATDERFRTNPARVKHREALIGELSRITQRRDTRTWLSELEAAGIPCAPVNTLAAAFADEQLVANQTLLEMQHPIYGLVHQIGPPFRFEGSHAAIRRRPPLLGEHTDEVLGDLLGVQAGELASLRSEGVIGQPSTPGGG